MRKKKKKKIAYLYEKDGRRTWESFYSFLNPCMVGALRSWNHAGLVQTHLHVSDLSCKTPPPHPTSLFMQEINNQTAERSQNMSYDWEDLHYRQNDVNTHADEM